nr:uncharacterized protein LOC126529699 [Dermacentor andersoni]
MELVKPPEHLHLSGSSDNIAKNWNLFIQKFQLFLQATASTKEPRSEAVRAALLLSVAGDDALEVFNNFTFLEAERKDDYTTVVRKFEEYCEEQQNEVYERVGIGIFQHGGSSYLCVFDAQSNFPEGEKLGDTTSSTVVAKLSCIFERYGITVEVCSDNGLQFASHEFATFASRYDFKHVTSSPGFPQSNGLAEKGVQIVKRIMKKTQENHDDFWLGLLSYRSTPLEHGRSPGELLQGRRLRTRLRDFSSQPKNFVSKHRQLGAHKKDLPVLRKGEVVRIRDKPWIRKAQVVGPAASRSYRIVTEDDQVLRRNRRHLIPTRERFRHDDLDSDEPESEDDQAVTSPTGLQANPTLFTTPIPRQSRRITRQPRRLQ